MADFTKRAFLGGLGASLSLAGGAAALPLEHLEILLAPTGASISLARLIRRQLSPTCRMRACAIPR